MKFKFSIIYKTYLLLLSLLSILLPSCQEADQGEVLPSEETIHLDYIRLQDSEKLNKGFLQVKQILSGDGNQRVQFPFHFDWDLVDQSRALRVPQRGDDRLAIYTFKVQQVEEGSFLNLVLKEHEEGFYAAVFEYQYSGNAASMAHVQQVTKYDLQGNELARYSLNDETRGNMRTQATCVTDVEVIVEYDCWNNNLNAPCHDAVQTYVLEITVTECDDSSEGSDWGDPLPGSGTGGGSGSGSGGSNGGASGGDGGSPGIPGEAEDEIVGVEEPDEEILLCSPGYVKVDGVCVNSKLALQLELRDTQDPDKARRNLLGYLDMFGGLEGKMFVAMYNELWNTPGLDYADKLKLNQMAYAYKQQLVAQYFIGIFNPETVGIIVGLAVNPTISSTLRNASFKIIPRYLSRANLGKGYASMYQFQKAHGAAGTGKA